MAAKGIKAMFEGSEGLVFCDTTVSIKGAMKAADVAAMEKLADEILA